MNFGQLTFTNTELSRTIPVGIINDNIVEADEFFFGNLFGGPVDPRFTLSPENATINIRNDDSKFLGSNVLQPICTVFLTIYGIHVYVVIII